MPLKGIPRIITPQLLTILSQMGHGDDLLISDANFPSHGQGVKEIVHLDGSSATEVLKAILELFPLDSFVKHQAAVMKQVDKHEDAEIVGDFQKILNDSYKSDGALHPVSIERVERFTFYERAKNCFAICVTGESRLYGNIIIKKGVIGENGCTVIISTSVPESTREDKKLRLTDNNNNTNGGRHEMVQVKKKRGRPRKNQSLEEKEEQEEEEEEEEEEEDSVSRKKQQRSLKKNSKKRLIQRNIETEATDNTITLFSFSTFRDSSLMKKKEAEEEKAKKVRKSLNSLSEQDQFELALKLSMSDASTKPPETV